MGSDSGIRLPKLGLTMTEGTLVEWLVRPGQQVAAGDLLYVCETEKIANEIESDRAGVVGDLVVAAGDTVPVGALLATWQGETLAAEIPAVTARAPASATTSAALPATRHAGTDGRRVATPHARKLARERGVDLAVVRGTGPGGRIKAGDVLAAAIQPAAATSRAGGATAGTPVAQSAAQRTVASRMAQSAREVPHFYLEATAEVGGLLDLHRQVKSRTGFAGLTVTHWLVQAIGLALAENALFRRVWQHDGVVELAGSDVAIAAASDRGLYVGVARDIAARSLRENVTLLDALVQRARDGRLGPEDVTGGATCLSNLGATRVRNVWPIILPGQSTIFGIGRTESLFRPDAEGKPRLARELHLVLACDHRVLNGMDGAQLLEAVLRRLEDPLDLLVHTGH